MTKKVEGGWTSADRLADGCGSAGPRLEGPDNSQEQLYSGWKGVDSNWRGVRRAGRRLRRLVGGQRVGWRLDNKRIDAKIPGQQQTNFDRCL